MELREELSHQHHRHIQDLQDRSRQETDVTLTQLRIRYEDEVEHLKQLHRKELEQKTGEMKREAAKQHKKELSQLKAKHQQEMELAQIREPAGKL